eukprot:COSAG04_NODE_11921_length_680_cov_1.941480_1_plen_60_part_10
MAGLYGGQLERVGKPSYIKTWNGWAGCLPSWRAAASNCLSAGADGLCKSDAYSLCTPRRW